MKPIIGIVARSSKDKESNILFVNNKIIEAITKCGAIPVLILPTQGIDYEFDKPSNLPRLSNENKKDLDNVLSKCDGIVMPGGYKWFEFDEYISKYAIDNDVPVLGICAGMQLLAKTLNNNRIDGIDNTMINNSLINHDQPGIKYAHEVNVLKDSFLYEILKKEKMKVNSRHKYHVPNKLKFLASAYSEDGLIEAVEYKNNKFALGIQWHPETMIEYDNDAFKIFEAFIKSCNVK